MSGPSNRETIDRFYRALNARNFGAIAELLDPDAVQVWPQSGEHFRGRDTIRAVLENYSQLPAVEQARVIGTADKWILTPSWTPLRITGTGDEYTVETKITYPNGETWSGVVIIEFQQGKVAKLTQYFAAPFSAAEWRSRWAEKMESQTPKT